MSTTFGSGAATTEVICSANALLSAHRALVERVRDAQQDHRQQLKVLYSPPDELLRLPLIPSPPPSPPPESSDEHEAPQKQPDPALRADMPPVKRARAARYHNYVPEEETIRNDYSQRYVDGGEWPQNWVMGAELDQRFDEYPKQKNLLKLKKGAVSRHALPPLYLPFDDLKSLHHSKFDIILLDPPFSTSFTWDDLQELPIPTLAADPSFVFLWVGSGAGEGLERGREILAKWGYRRCEDVVWVKTNARGNLGPGTDQPTTSLLTRTKQHCLMGIRGTVRRSTDSWFVHCNVDTDVIIWEGDPLDPTRKPPEMYTLIENFCLGLRRLEIFGRAHSSLRRGWVTVLGRDQEEHLKDLHSGSHPGSYHVSGEDGGEARRWDREAWEEGIKQWGGGTRLVVPTTSEIDTLRPKSPFRPGQNTGSNPTTGVQPAVLPAPNVGPRFGTGNRVGFGMHGGPQIQMSGQNQLGVQPMLAMGMNNLNVGLPNPHMPMDDVISNWNPMMGNMNVAAAAAGMAGIPNLGMQGMGMSMMNQMAMSGNFQNQNPGFNTGMVFNPNMHNPNMHNHPGMAWNDQMHYPVEGGWEGDGQMNGMGMGMSGGHMGMNHWAGGGAGHGHYEGY